MKYFIYGLLATVLVSSCKQAAKSYSPQAIDTLREEMNDLLYNNDDDNAAVIAKTKEMLASDNEDLVMFAFDEFYEVISSNQNKIDSLTGVITTKFPKGVLARNKAVFDLFTSERDTDVLLEGYKKWKQQYPPESYEMHKRDVYSGILTGGLFTYMVEDGKLDLIDAIAEAEFVEYPYIAVDYMNMTQFYLNANKLPLAKKYLDKGRASIDKWQPNTDLSKDVKRFIATEAQRYLAYKAQIQFAEGNYTEANKTFKTYFGEQLEEGSEPVTVLTYAKSLAKAGQADLALEQLEYYIVNFGETKESLDLLDKVYLEGNPENTNGLIAYKAQLLGKIAEKKGEQIREESYFRELPNFQLQDLEGNTVTKNNFKGKIVVYDLWATWCGPCIESMPAMLAVKEHYKNDPEVDLVFVNTGERIKGDERIAKVKKVLASKGVNTASALLDMPYNKDGDYILSDSLFYVMGLPFKGIVDQNGNLIYDMLGGDYNEETEAKNMIATIEALRNTSLETK